MKIKYNIYMNNLYSDAALLSFLRYQGQSAIGTIRNKRIPKKCPLINKQFFLKKHRGYFETALEGKD